MMHLDSNIWICRFGFKLLKYIFFFFLDNLKWLRNLIWPNPPMILNLECNIWRHINVTYQNIINESRRKKSCVRWAHETHVSCLNRYFLIYKDLGTYILNTMSKPNKLPTTADMHMHTWHMAKPIRYSCPCSCFHDGSQWDKRH